jgi:alpha/beta superfamily hydrolase
MVLEIRSDVELPSVRQEVELKTADGETLVGELALPIGLTPTATLITLHPLPTHGGFMDSHIYRKAANRLPALANLAVLRFNTRGTESPRGRSSGSFDSGEAEKYDLAAALDFALARGLPNLWLVGWSFGTEIAIKYGPDHPEISGAILLSPPLRRASESDLDRWIAFGKPLIALVPELDEFLTPEQAAPKFARVPQAKLIAAAGAKHLWVGESSTRFVLNQIVKAVRPGFGLLPDSI